MKQKRLGFTFATLPSGGFVMRVIGSNSTVFPSAREAAQFLRDIANRLDKVPTRESLLTRIRRRFFGG